MNYKENLYSLLLFEHVLAMTRSFSTVFFEMSIQAVCNALINSSTLLIVNFNNLLSIIDQIFSIIFICGLFAGQIICLIRFLFK